MNVALGYGATAGNRFGPRFQRPDATFAYREHPLQQMDFYHTGDSVRPLILFVHGGAWQFGDKARRRKDRKVGFAREEDWHFAAANFRLVPEVGVREMAQDLAAALAAIIGRAGELGVDPNRIVVMGHSSGAHLAALVATDPAYLASHGLAPDCIAGVIANDGAAYDARLPSTSSGFLDRRLLAPAFAGQDLAALSPAHHARIANTLPPFLILHAARSHGRSQAEVLAEALLSAGGQIQLCTFPDKGVLGHVRMSRRFGRSGYGPTEAARSWLRTLP